MVLNQPVEIASNQQTATPELLELLAGCRAENRSAQAQLYKKYHGKLLGLCMRYFTNRDDALEALNHGFLKIFKNLDNYNPDFAFEAWSYKIMQNTALDYMRKKYRQDWMRPMDKQDLEIAILPDVDRKFDAGELISLLHKLAPATRTVFNLFAIEGYKHEEIATLLDISVGTSKWHVNQARAILKDLIMNKNNHGE